MCAETLPTCIAPHFGHFEAAIGLPVTCPYELDPALTAEPPTRWTPPGDPQEAAALGCLHGNCGHCHNPDGSARPDTDLDLNLRTTDRSATDVAAYQTSVGVPLQYFDAEDGSLRVVAGRPEQSTLRLRMQQRGADTQMPPLGTEQPDPSGLSLVHDWIESLR